MSKAISRAIILTIALVVSPFRARAQDSVFYAGAGGVVQQGYVPWEEHSGSTPQETLNIEFFGSIGSHGVASAVADRGVLRCECHLENPDAGPWTPQCAGNGLASITVYDAIITGPPGSPVSATLHLLLTGSLSRSGNYPWTPGIEVSAMADGQQQTGSVVWRGGGLESSGLLSGQTTPVVDQVLDIPLTLSVGNLFQLSYSLTASVGGTVVSVGVNTGDSNFMDSGFRFPAGTPVLTLPAGYTFDVPSLNVVDNLWQGATAAVIAGRSVREPVTRISVQPNPMRSFSTIAFDLPTDAPTRLEVFDTFGRKQTTLLDGQHHAGPGSLVWDGRDSRGVEVPAGVYFVRLESAGVRGSCRVTCVR